MAIHSCASCNFLHSFQNYNNATICVCLFDLSKHYLEEVEFCAEDCELDEYAEEIWLSHHSDSQSIDICPICGATIDPTDGEDNGYGQLHLYWTCESCGGTGTAVLDQHNDNAFVEHVVD